MHFMTVMFMHDTLNQDSLTHFLTTVLMCVLVLDAIVLSLTEVYDTMALYRNALTWLGSVTFSLLKKSWWRIRSWSPPCLLPEGSEWLTLQSYLHDTVYNINTTLNMTDERGKYDFVPCKDLLICADSSQVTFQQNISLMCLLMRLDMLWRLSV